MSDQSQVALDGLNLSDSSDLSASALFRNDRDPDLLDREWTLNQPVQSRSAALIPYFNAFFLTIATVLGTGILGIPVKLSQTGFQPFILNYFLIFIMQALILIFTVEVMQRGRIVEENETATAHKAVPLDEFNTSNLDDDSEIFFDETIRKGAIQASGEATETEEHTGGDLHNLGRMFLTSKLMMILFDIAVMLHFISILISYTLAGSVAWGQLFGLNHTQFTPIIPPFVVLGTILLVLGTTFFPKLFHSGMSLATFFKGSLLVLMVVVTALVAMEVDQEIVNEWRYIGKPFLVGTVAMGGAVNILPVVFAKIRLLLPSPHFQQSYSPWGYSHSIQTARNQDFHCSDSALFVVWVLNVLWCYFLLKTIPTGVNPNGGDTSTPTQRDEVLTLHDAEKEGLPSTVPLVNIIETSYRQFLWIATTVDVFIVTSITVSFVVVGTGMKHVLDGFVSQWKTTPLQATVTFASDRSFLDKAKTFFLNLNQKWKQIGLYVLSFGFVLVIAFTNPKSFLQVLERVTSLALNLEAGLFIVVMLVTSRKLANTPIPMMVPDKLYAVRYVVMAFFIAACVYDLVSFIFSAATDIDYL